MELGCGPGYLWLKNRDRIPAGWSITLSDLSAGMVREARLNLGPGDEVFVFETADAQWIPHPSDYFDAVVANHMLYHVPDKPKAFSEIRRMLKVGGSLYAATNGEDDMPELQDILEQVRQAASSESAALSFTLENGPNRLAASFANVRLHRYEDTLDVTETGPLVGYLLSVARDDVSEDGLKEFIAFVDAEITRHGTFRINKAMGVLEARK